jgi:hypothetical protein
MSIQPVVDDFLKQKRIAVVGVSATKQDAANFIYRTLRERGYEVYAINPNAAQVEGDTAYPDVKSTPEKPDAAVIVTRPEVTEQVVRECDEAGIKRVWMHHSLDMLGRSSSPKAVQYCQEHGIAVISGGCPMMFLEPVDFGHKCMRTVSRWMGHLPK